MKRAIGAAILATGATVLLCLPASASGGATGAVGNPAVSASSGTTSESTSPAPSDNSTTQAPAPTSGATDSGDTQANPPATASIRDLNCDRFSSQSEAQSVYDQDTTDPNNLDADDDGIACETLPSSDSSSTTSGTGDTSQVTEVPAGSADTGGGSMAGSDGPLALTGQR